MSIAVVTGAAGGIGRALNRTLGRQGHTVAVVDLEADRCAAEVASLAAEGIDAFAAPADIADAGAVEAMARIVLARGAVAVVVNNAGRASAPSFEAASGVADWHEAQSVNLNGAYYVARQFLPGMKAATSGVIVNIASTNGFGAYGNPAYSVAKAGLLHFTRQLAVEYGPFGIRAVSVVPASVRTPAWDHRLAKNPKLFDEILKFYPLRRIVEPQDVANVVAFAVSDAARAISGSELVVDCGALAGNSLIADLITEADA
jgi:NAD(P)-dependent dehydrogenase (short-subunit alcohol dehydrogenase family)